MTRCLVPPLQFSDMLLDIDCVHAMRFVEKLSSPHGGRSSCRGAPL